MGHYFANDKLYKEFPEIVKEEIKNISIKKLENVDNYLIEEKLNSWLNKFDELIKKLENTIDKLESYNDFKDIIEILEHVVEMRKKRN